MHIRGKVLAVSGAALLLSGCTAAEWEALAVGLSVAAIAASEVAAQSANQSISCPYGQHIEYGYDSYGNEVAFCIDDQPWSQEQSQQQN
ncbi:hypothetical protein LY632_06405 [Erythrobacter sp. SDW2]|uniref:hypothetical protein n=1 Tax=Erythrobacter sp. SDW2 TaxID=2907154 RepID=UPI001F44E093|nr:hypothetical protein [Erythrobacter sp. SDW2]UIP08019.1 hypothetical protein LY632_06405 [Erythrobacter sp. SDW2]